MSKSPEQDWRQKRLSDLVAVFGGKASLGRALGFRDGAYIGQMLSGERPITEKLIDKAHALRGYAGWFDPKPAPDAHLAQRIAAADTVTRRLIELALLESDKEAAAQLTPSLLSLVQAAKSLIKDVEDPT